MENPVYICLHRNGVLITKKEGWDNSYKRKFISFIQAGSVICVRKTIREVGRSICNSEDEKTIIFGNSFLYPMEGDASDAYEKYWEILLSNNNIFNSCPFPKSQAGYYEGIHFNQADINKEGKKEKSVSSIRSTSMDAIRSIAPSIHSIIYQALP